MSDWNDTRTIAARLIVTGELRLESPAHLGSGEGSELVDMALLRDPREGGPLLPGTSIAGALRSYLRAYEYGDFDAEDKTARDRAAALLFGGVKGDEDGEQSPLIVDDALAGQIAPEIRDGVRIDGKTRTAADQLKYDIELLPPDTLFPLRFELLLPDDAERATKLRAALALTLCGLEQGEIPLGARKTRGYGRCTVNEWTATTYRLRESRADLLTWLAADQPTWGRTLPTTQIKTGKAVDALGVTFDKQDQRQRFTIAATFALASPLLIRSEEPLTSGDNQPDVAYLRDGAGKPVLSGTSLAGALRARATRILTTIGHPRGAALLTGVFGKDMRADRRDPTASRLIVHESRIEQGAALVQNRVGIDRFTGGAFDTALFGEAPYLGGTITLTLTLRAPQDAEKGLLLLLLKDLWTGDLPLGGTASIGRGRLRGIRATICDEDSKTYTLDASGDGVRLNDQARERIEHYVGVLNAAREGSHVRA